MLSVIMLCAAGWLGLAALAVMSARRRWATTVLYPANFVVAAAAIAISVLQLIGPGMDAEEVLPLGLPWIGAHFRLDALSAFFLLVVDLAVAAASVYAIGYGRHEREPQRVLPFYAAFLAGMNLVILAADAFTFLLSWEFMSLTSWALVMADHRASENRRAGYVYLLMASFGTLSLLLAFGLMAGPEGGYAFDSIRGLHHTAGVSALVLALVLLGAGSKAGLAPLHVWLPLAHPAAPSHVSALMSGAMTKVAIYAFVRIVFDLLGQPAWWWGLVVLALGGGTAVLGVLQALMQRDLKRLLAYSTVENIGIIFVGLGLALAFQANGFPGAAALALTAALLHALNHALFKSLLFFGSGAVLARTGEHDMELLGGLIHRMPMTSFSFLAGAVAISALPPMNGFVSEWMTFQAILLSPDLPQWGLKIAIPAVGGLLALSAALSAACFVRGFGITFLGRPRGDAAARAQEVDGFSLSAMFALAVLCLLVGIVPGVLIDGLAPVTHYLVGGQMPAQADVPWLSIVPIAASRSSYNGLLVFLFSAASAWIAALVIHRFASRAIRRAAPWDCGYPDPRPLTQYSAGSFAQPIRRVFGQTVFQAREHVEIPPPGSIGAARFRLDLRDLVWEGMYEPIVGAVDFAADRLNHMQFLTIRRYLSLVFLALVALLLVLAIWL